MIIILAQAVLGVFLLVWAFTGGPDTDVQQVLAIIAGGLFVLATVLGLAREDRTL